MNQDRDPAETREWLDALDSVEAFEGIGRVDELLDGIVLAARVRARSCPLPPTPHMSTPSRHMTSRLCVPKTLSEFDGVMESPKLAE